MAIVIQNFMLKGLKGTLGKSVVFKQYRGRTIVCAYPEKKHVKPTLWQKQNNERFKRAVAYAKAILADPKKSAAYAKKVKKGERVYHYAIREYMRKTRELDVRLKV